MGARESRAAHDGADSVDTPIDYYQLLEVEETATQDEIRVSVTVLLYLANSTDSLPTVKRSFRRLALLHHPDKNHGNVEEATKRFAAIQQAYEVHYFLHILQ